MSASMKHFLEMQGTFLVIFSFYCYGNGQKATRRTMTLYKQAVQFRLTSEAAYEAEFFEVLISPLR